jgi:hypothetical protein
MDHAMFELGYVNLAVFAAGQGHGQGFACRHGIFNTIILFASGP